MTGRHQQRVAVRPAYRPPWSACRGIYVRGAGVERRRVDVHQPGTAEADEYHAARAQQRAGVDLQRSGPVQPDIGVPCDVDRRAEAAKRQDAKPAGVSAKCQAAAHAHRRAAVYGVIVAPGIADDPVAADREFVD